MWTLPEEMRLEEMRMLQDMKNSRKKIQTSLEKIKITGQKMFLNYLSYSINAEYNK